MDIPHHAELQAKKAFKIEVSKTHCPVHGQTATIKNINSREPALEYCCEKLQKLLEPKLQHFFGR